MSTAFPRVSALLSSNDLTAAWLSSALKQPISSIEKTVLGVGESSSNIRCAWTDDAGAQQSVVVKLPSEKPGSRAHAVNSGLYEHEVMFYREFSGKLDTIPIAHQSYLDDTGCLTLVMEDFPGCRQIDNMEYISAQGAEVILSTLAETQGPMLGDWMWAGTMPWLKDGVVFNAASTKAAYPTFRKKFASHLSAEQLAVIDWFISVAESWESAVIPPLGLCHNDFRLDNVLFTKDDKCIIIDWATVSWGPAFRDVAYFMATSLTTAEWKKNGRQLFDFYLRELDSHSEIHISREKAWRDFSSQTLHALNFLVGCLGELDLSERAIELGTNFITAAVALVLDVDARTVVEQDIARASVPLVPALEDDHLHPVAPGERFNESFYYDVHTATETIYMRYGRLPNQNKAPIWIVIMVQGHPLYQIEIADAECPEPDNKVAEITHERVWFKHEVVSPMKEVRLQCKGKATAFKNQTAPIWHQPSLPDLVDVEIDITWKNVGRAMMWRITPRWECPSNAEGVIRIAGEEIKIKGPGQRDHSWGMRDWWKFNGNWGNLHFDDGTRIQFQSEDNDAFCQGYTQNLNDGSLVEHTWCHVDSDWYINGRLKRATVFIQPGDQEIHITPVMQGGHRLLGPEGRTTVWPRCKVTAKTKDGVEGIGLMEQFFVENAGPHVAKSFVSKKKKSTVK